MGEEVGAYKNREDEGSAHSGRGGGRVIADQRNNLTSFMMHRKMTRRRAKLAAMKAARNRGGGRGSGPSHPTKKIGLEKLILLGRLAGREEVGEDDNIMRDLTYRNMKGGYGKARKGLTFTLRAQTQIRHSGKLFFILPPLLIGLAVFRLFTKDLTYSK